MHYKAGKLLNDILNRTQYLLDVAASTNPDAFLSEIEPHTLAERHFEVIAEAGARSQRIDPKTASRLVSLEDARGLRNFIAHGYDDVEILEGLWSYMTEQAPTLKVECDQLLRQYIDTFGKNPEPSSY